MTTVYVAIYYAGREKYEFEAECVGVFANEIDAHRALIAYAFRERHLLISRDDDDDRDDDATEEEIEEMVGKCTTFEDVLYFDEVDDNSYLENWKVKVVKQVIS